MAEIEKEKKTLEAEHLTAGGIWKGENESDAEQMDGFDANPLA